MRTIGTIIVASLFAIAPTEAVGQTQDHQHASPDSVATNGMTGMMGMAGDMAAHMAQMHAMMCQGMPADSALAEPMAMMGQMMATMGRMMTMMSQMETMHGSTAPDSAASPPAPAPGH